MAYDCMSSEDVSRGTAAPASAKARTVPNQKPADDAGPPLDLQARARHLINCDLRFIANINYSGKTVNM